MTIGWFIFLWTNVVWWGGVLYGRWLAKRLAHKDGAGA